MPGLECRGKDFLGLALERDEPRAGLAQGRVEVGKGLEEEGDAVRAHGAALDEPGVEAEHGQQRRRAVRGREQRGVVVDPQALQ